MLIGICDDEVIIRDELQRLCEKFIASNLTSIETIYFASGEEVLACKRSVDILFLDIQMKGINGMQTAKKIREKDDSMIIIFLTGFRNYIQEGYRVRAFRYLLKPITEKEFMGTLMDAMNDLTRNYKVILGSSGETLFVKLKDILYVEYVGRVTVVRTKRGSYETRIPVKEWEGILDNGDFFRVHKAYIVNLAYIDEIGRDILLENGEKVEVAIRQIGKLKKACNIYRRRNAR